MKKLIVIIGMVFLASCDAESIPQIDEPTLEPVITFVNITQTETVPNNNYLGGSGTYKLWHIERNGTGGLLDTNQNRVRHFNSVWTFTILSQVKNIVTQQKFVDGVLESETMLLEEFVMSGNYSYFQTVFQNREIKYQKRYGVQTLRYHIDINGNEWFLYD
jgi:hypothetical protein